MNFLRKIAIYLLGMLSILIVGCFWQLKYGSGRADFSFLILVPFAVGLLRARRWAVWGTGALGMVTAMMSVGIALGVSISGMTGLTVGFGPVVLTHPTAIDLWAFALAYLALFGIPMMRVFTKRGQMAP